MFLGTMRVPASGDTLILGDKALACCREQLCPKFTTQSDCAWISSGDLSWKQKLSDDLDKVQTIDHRLQQLKADDMDDPAAVNEERILEAERERIENSELQRLAKVAPLTAMCDQVLDSGGFPGPEGRAISITFPCVCSALACADSALCYLVRSLPPHVPVTSLSPCL